MPALYDFQLKGLVHRRTNIAQPVADMGEGSQNIKFSHRRRGNLNFLDMGLDDVPKLGKQVVFRLVDLRLRVKHKALHLL